MNRNFTIFYSSLGVKGSRYSDTVPINVAKKFAKKIFSNNNICKIDFCIRETTKNSKKKLYYYTAIKKGDNIKVKSDRKKKQKGVMMLHLIIDEKPDKSYAILWLILY